MTSIVITQRVAADDQRHPGPGAASMGHLLLSCWLCTGAVASLEPDTDDGPAVTVPRTGAPRRGPGIGWQLGGTGALVALTAGSVAALVVDHFPLHRAGVDSLALGIGAVSGEVLTLMACALPPFGHHTHVDGGWERITGDTASGREVAIMAGLALFTMVPLGMGVGLGAAEAQQTGWTAAWRVPSALVLSYLINLAPALLSITESLPDGWAGLSGPLFALSMGATTLAAYDLLLHVGPTR